MTRQQAEAQLKAMGIAEPSKEQIDSFLNSVNGEVQREKERADKYKAEADKVGELQSQLDEINNKNLSDIEKVNKALEQANATNQKLEKQIVQMQTKAKLAEFGVTGETADKLIDENGALSLDVFGQILSDAKATAAAAKEAELAGKAGNPAGGNPGNDGNGGVESEGAKYAKQFSAQYTTQNTNGGN